ncbi:MAG TPA: alpha/beta fold hydrolase [Gemmatimonadota bacterium]|nr:alpha/beta fold hydrolase [Gemmatimonadota bacterium]
MVDLHCLHGTFQTPVVWSALATRLAGYDEAGDAVRVLAEDVAPPAAGGLETWATELCRRRDTPGAEGESHVLLGYSLGGRLAMHALVACPRAWSAAVLVAAHPGGGTDAERATVRRRDARWAERCRHDPWENVLADWDAQSVFGGRPNGAPRPPGGFDRERCARTFEAFSRAGQDDLRPLLEATRLPPILYVTGTEDTRYGALGDELAGRVPSIAHVVVAGAGHRVPWDRPDDFAAVVRRFLREVIRP